MTPMDRREFLGSAAGTVLATSIFPSTLPAALRLADPIRVGIVGMGKQGTAILDELQKLDAAKVVAVVDADAKRLDRAAKRAAGLTPFASHAELLDKAKDVQAIIVATPTHAHKAVVLDALAAGKHVYVEAPIAHTIDDSRAIAAAGRGSKTVVVAGLEGRSNPIYQLARTFFRSGATGKLVAMHAQNSQKSTWRVPGGDPERDRAFNWKLDEAVSLGLLGELGTHHLDVFSWYRDQYPASVRASGRVAFHDDGRKVHDTVHADLAYPDGAVLSFAATLANSYQGKFEVFQGSDAAIRLAWTHGWMFKEADAPTQGWEVYANRQQFHTDQGITLIADATKLAAQGKLKEGVGLPGSSLSYALADFLAAIAGAKPPAASIEVGHRATVLGILAAQAAAKGSTVDIPPDALKA